jgi:hypothetical protein
LDTTVEATASRAKAGVVNPSEDSDDIDIEEGSTTIHPTKPNHMNLSKKKSKEDTLRYLTTLAILIMSIGCG